MPSVVLSVCQTRVLSHCEHNYSLSNQLILLKSGVITGPINHKK